jgi:hypothetical protein
VHHCNLQSMRTAGQEALVDKLFWQQFAQKEGRAAAHTAIAYDGLDFDEDIPQAILDAFYALFLQVVWPWFPFYCDPSPTFGSSQYLQNSPVLWNAILATVTRMCTTDCLLAYLGPELARRYNLSALGDLFYNKARYHFLKSMNEVSQNSRLAIRLTGPSAKRLCCARTIVSHAARARPRTVLPTVARHRHRLQDGAGPGVGLFVLS